MTKNLTCSLLLLLGGIFIFGCKKNTGSAGQSGEAAIYQELSAKRIKLPNGWSLTPVGRGLDLDDLPLTW